MFLLLVGYFLICKQTGLKIAKLKGCDFSQPFFFDSLDFQKTVIFCLTNTRKAQLMHF